MALAQVGWQLSEGTRAIHSFLVMLQEAAKGCGVTPKKWVKTVKGIYKYVGFKLQDKRYVLVLDLEDPGKVWFGTRSQIDPEAAQRLGEGEVRTDEGPPPPPTQALPSARWYRAGDLDSEEVHFYSRSKVEQIRWLEKFLRECLDMARRIETADQPPIPPDEPGEE